MKALIRNFSIMLFLALTFPVNAEEYEIYRGYVLLEDGGELLAEGRSWRECDLELNMLPVPEGARRVECRLEFRYVDPEPWFISFQFQSPWPPCLVGCPEILDLSQIKKFRFDAYLHIRDLMKKYRIFEYQQELRSLQEKYDLIGFDSELYLLNEEFLLKK